jgi:hypothetical protein
MDAADNHRVTQEINHVLHVLRNPYGWNEDQIRDARLTAADIIERMGKELQERALDGCR